MQGGAISSEQLHFALRSQTQRGGRLGTNLVELGFLSESALARTLAVQLRLPAASAAALDAIPADVIALLPADSAAHHRAVPVRLEGNQLWVAMSDPTDAAAVAEIHNVTRCGVRPLVAPDLLIAYALERHYGVRHQHRPVDMRVSPHLDLTIETPLSAPRDKAPPTAFPDPYTPHERARIDARVMDLDAVQPPARLGLASVGARFVAAGSQREVFDAIVAFLAQDFRRITVLVLRNGRLVGFRAFANGRDLEALPDASALPDEVAIVAKVFMEGRPRLGRASEKTFGALTPLVGKPDGRAVLVMPVRCAGENIGCIVAVGGSDGVEAYADEYDRVGAKSDLALQSVALRRRIIE